MIRIFSGDPAVIFFLLNEIRISLFLKVGSGSTFFSKIGSVSLVYSILYVQEILTQSIYLVPYYTSLVETAWTYSRYFRRLDEFKLEANYLTISKNLKLSNFSVYYYVRGGRGVYLIQLGRSGRLNVL